MRNRVLAAEVERLLGEEKDENVLEGLSHAAANLFLGLAYRKPFYSLLTAITSRRLYRRAANRMSYRVSPSLRMRRSDWGVVESRLQEWSADAEKHADFWSEVAKYIPDWGRAKTGEVSPGDLRKTFVHAHAIALRRRHQHDVAAGAQLLGRLTVDRDPRAERPQSCQDIGGELGVLRRPSLRHLPGRSLRVTGRPSAPLMFWST